MSEMCIQQEPQNVLLPECQQTCKIAGTTIHSTSAKAPGFKSLPDQTQNQVDIQVKTQVTVLPFCVLRLLIGGIEPPATCDVWCVTTNAQRLSGNSFLVHIIAASKAFSNSRKLCCMAASLLQV